MDAKHFDTLTRALSERSPRRGLLGLLTTLPVLDGFFALLDFDEETDAKGRRKRRKKAHKHGKGPATGEYKKHKPRKPCKPAPKSSTCAGKCGKVKNNCKKTVDCGPCACDPPCGVCETCRGDLVCEPCEPCCDDVCCSQANAICHVETGACCVPDSTAQTCNNQCGDIVNNCGLTVDCGPCTCGGSCPECYVCDEASNDCAPDPSQEGDDCGEAGQVCQIDGSCACDATTCPACTTCENTGFCEACAGCCDAGVCVDTCGDCQICDNGQCSGCPDCCDAEGVCQDGDTNAACGSSGACDVCTGQEECQNQSCVCIPDCDGKVCGPDGCGDECGPGCAACESCQGDGTCSTVANGTTCDGDNVCCSGVCQECCTNAQCSGGSPICDNGTCVPCSLDNPCPSGCCNEATGACVQNREVCAGSGATASICCNGTCWDGCCDADGAPGACLAFVTGNPLFTGDLDGLAGADAICQARADANDLPGTYTAWLSIGRGENESPATGRFRHSGQPYRRIDGAPIAANWAGLTSAELQNPLNVSATGEVSDQYVWTNTTTGGRAYLGDCRHWTDGTNSLESYGIVGWSRFTQDWTTTDAIECGYLAGLFCFQQT